MPDVVDHATCGFEKTDPLAICSFWYNNYVYATHNYYTTKYR